MGFSMFLSHAEHQKCHPLITGGRKEAKRKGSLTFQVCLGPTSAFSFPDVQKPHLPRIFYLWFDFLWDEFSFTSNVDFISTILCCFLSFFYVSFFFSFSLSPFSIPSSLLAKGCLHQPSYISTHHLHQSLQILLHWLYTLTCMILLSYRQHLSVFYAYPLFV